ncbi:MAG: exosortase-associated EpsI family protein, partial [Verrucomicrobiales bacterium]
YQEKQNEVGLFVHTPDRCWTQAGWKMEPVETNLIELEIHGTRIPIERRLFIGGTKRELVYFFGLVGGQPLPYRLDHNYSVGMRLTEKRKKGNVGAGLRASDNQFWTRIWESFTSRSELLGPKQFIRISTPVRGSDLESGDVLLQRTLHQWLTPGEFQSEFASWKAEHKKL